MKTVKVKKKVTETIIEEEEEDNTISEVQQEVNDAECDWFEEQVRQQRSRFEEHFRFSVKNALEYNCSESTVEDWLETPEVIAKLIIELQHHAKAVASHLKIKDAEESTASLRLLQEKNHNDHEKQIRQLKQVTGEKFKQISRKNTEQDQFVQAFEENYKQFYQKNTVDMAKAKLLDLVPGLTEEDIKPDSEDV